MKPPDLSALAIPGARLAVKVTPSASRLKLEVGSEGLKAWVTAAPEDGKANTAVTRLLAKALGIAPSRLRLVSGATSRQKVFEVAG